MITNLLKYMITEINVEQIWKKMGAIYGHKWSSEHGIGDDGTWLAALQHFTPEQIITGLNKMLASGEAWPPSLPEFISLCVVNIPELETVIQAIFRRKYTDPVMLWIKKQIGSWDLDHDSEKVLRKKIGMCYVALKSEAIRNPGKSLEAPK